ALGAAAPAAPAPGPSARVPRAPAAAVAAEAETLLAVLRGQAERTPDAPHFILHGESGDEEVVTYGEFLRAATAIAGGLQARDLAPGDKVALMLPTGRDYFASFYGVLLAGGVPVPIYPPARPAQLEDHLRRHARILENAEARLIIAPQEVLIAARLLKAQVEQVRAVVNAGELGAGAPPTTLPRVRATDIAMLQYTSGSTGNPKGVVLSHAQLLANIRAMGAAVRATSADVFVSWMPLYHDMGLIGAWLGSLYHGIPLVVMSPLTFLTRPERWLWAMHRHRATISGAPNFGYELCLRRIDEHAIEGLDLSSWRLAFNGAEPVSPDTIERFCARFGRYGFRRSAMAPVYGLAEVAVGLAFPPLDRPPRIDSVGRDALLREGLAQPAAPGEARAAQFVACGRPLPGYAIRIVDEQGRELPERRQGRLEFRGPSATIGYYRNPAATAALIRDGWLDSGDLAYLADGEVYITGRIKDVIIHAGRNLHPQELEEAVGNLAGVRKGCVAVFGARPRGADTERLVVVAETRAGDAPALARLRAAVNTLAIELVGTPPDDVVLAPPHTVLKTSSGKIRRAASRELYERGALAAARRPPWRQLARVAVVALRPEIRRLLHAAFAVAYAAYAWCLFALIAPLAWLAVALAPRPRRARAIVRRAARAVAWLSGTRLAVHGLEHLPRTPCLVVANHASYLDGIALSAVLPPVFGFVAKREFLAGIVGRIFFRRLQAEFVERFDVGRGIEDARRLATTVRAGRSLLVFPEGTFRREAGLLPFHLGAFVTAAEAGVPVVPCAIRGTRAMLRDDEWFPRHGTVTITFAAPLTPDGRGFEAALKLRDAARAAILPDCGEPDLGAASTSA
ncbi:MAG: AMP-binding protein, partial [Gammaproteobacteria bacterium]|nr:AMP-binding protein [Gammaproteobacteria bacterium]